MTDPIARLLDDLQQATTVIEAHSLVTEYTLTVEQGLLDSLVGSIDAAALWGVTRQLARRRLASMPDARQVGREWIASRRAVATYVAGRPGPKRR